MTGPRYVYAVCRPFGTPLQAQLTGVAGAPAKLLNHHGLTAVVSEVPARDFAEEPLRDRLGDPRWLSATERSHHQVVDALTAVTTPVPLPPGTVFRDDSGVRVMIEYREDDLRAALDRLDGRVEWGVRVTAGSLPGPEAARFADRLHTRLTEHAEEARRHAPGGDVLAAAYLVPRARSEEFAEVVERARAAASGTAGPYVELAGPWAAYSFVESFAEPESFRV
ncbi:GvpL/GvpF family gas vesicle protein [Streptomyces sp. NPDC086091]|uniref:GvpL/GvpF family gas vesicle protein n=1 Tax=Streptomyces sp. NPDC086091 TaxID=3365751 RepID=UPI0037F73185